MIYRNIVLATNKVGTLIVKVISKGLIPQGQVLLIWAYNKPFVSFLSMRGGILGSCFEVISYRSNLLLLPPIFGLN